MTLPCHSWGQISIYLVVRCSIGYSSNALGVVYDSVQARWSRNFWVDVCNFTKSESFGRFEVQNDMDRI